MIKNFIESISSSLKNYFGDYLVTRIYDELEYRDGEYHVTINAEVRTFKGNYVQVKLCEVQLIPTKDNILVVDSVDFPVLRYEETIERSNLSLEGNVEIIKGVLETDRVKFVIENLK